MKKIGFLGAYDKTNFITYTAKVLRMLDYKVLVIDASDIQKLRYVVPSINPTKTYITNFENIDFAVGFESWEKIERYLGIDLDTNETVGYDYVLLDIDNSEKLENFEMENAYKNYFVTSFDMFSLKKGLCIFQNLNAPMKLTKILFTYEISKEDEEYLNYISLESKINWKNYSMYFQILDSDNKVFEENQRIEKIRFKRLSTNYKDSLAYVIQDILDSKNQSKIKRIMKD